MSAPEWFVVLFGVEVLALLIAAILFYRGSQRAETRVLQFGQMLDRAESIVERGENAAIQWRACIAWQMDVLQEQRRDHPVVPPDSLPDEMEGAA